MKKRFEILFIKSLKIINWLESPGYLEMKKAGNIIGGVFILVSLILYFLEGVSLILDNILLGLLIITMFTIFFFIKSSVLLDQTSKSYSSRLRKSGTIIQ